MRGTERAQGGCKLQKGRGVTDDVDRVAALGDKRLARRMEPLTLHGDHRPLDMIAALNASVGALKRARRALLEVAAGALFARQEEIRVHHDSAEREGTALRAQLSFDVVPCCHGSERPMSTQAGSVRVGARLERGRPKRVFADLTWYSSGLLARAASSPSHWRSTAQPGTDEYGHTDAGNAPILPTFCM